MCIFQLPIYHLKSLMMHLNNYKTCSISPKFSQYSVSIMVFPAGNCEQSDTDGMIPG